MNTPICDFVRQYAASGAVRMHMPGHKGESRLGPEALDITEIRGADVLYHARGIIRESEENAARLFGSGKSLYSAEGSSLAIRAMLALTCRYALSRGKTPRIAAGRNAHKVFITAAALLDAEVCWLYPEEQTDLLSCQLSPRELEQQLLAMEELPTAVYLTSPDYLGNEADLGAMAELCHRLGCLLLVDNAHGAYLHFLPAPRHPMDLGADLCCDSAHKTLPVLTGGAYLHISKEAPSFFAEHGEEAMALFASTSPSYLILQSLDLCNPWLEALPGKLRETAEAWNGVKAQLRGLGLELAGTEELKLTLLPKSYGYTGEELGDHLEDRGFVCEFADADHLVLMLPVEPGPGMGTQLVRLLQELPRRAPIREKPPLPGRCERVLPLRRALLGLSEEIPVEEAEGRIMADPMVSCPPAIPIAVSGERIDRRIREALEYYGVRTLRVVCRSDES